MRNAMVVAELALAVPLLAETALVTQGLIALRRVDPGFQVDRALTLQISLPPARRLSPRRSVIFCAPTTDGLDQSAPRPGRMAFCGSWTGAINTPAIKMPRQIRKAWTGKKGASGEFVIPAVKRERKWQGSPAAKTR